MLGCAIMGKIEKRFVELTESEARGVIKSAVAVGAFQGGLLLVLLCAVLALGIRILNTL